LGVFLDDGPRALGFSDEQIAALDQDHAINPAHVSSSVSVSRSVLEVHRILAYVKVPAPQKAEVLEHGDDIGTHVAWPAEWIRAGVKIDGRAECVHGQVRF